MSKELELMLAKVQAKLEIERAKVTEVYKQDFLRFAKDNLIVKPKEIDEGYKAFDLFPAQLRIHQEIEAQRASTGRVRAIILKARQQGISTYTAGRTYWRTTTSPLYQSVVITHRADTTKLLYDMTKRFHELQPDEYRPKLKSSNRDGMVFAGLDSSYLVYTAGSTQVGRGTTPTILHASEVAFWPNANELISGLFQGVASVDGTEIIIESTANGVGGAFYELWKDAEREQEKARLDPNYKISKNTFIPIFIPWFEEPKYRSEVTSYFERTHEEDEYAAKYELDDEQLMFRREKCAGGREELFKQEYPSSAEEAFLVAGSAVFNQEALAQYLPEKPLIVEEWAGNPRLMFDMKPTGNLELWQYQSKGTGYVIGVDVGHGVGQDFSCAVIMDERMNIVGMFRDNQINPGSFGEMLVHLGRRFNNALVVCESNGPGVATLTEMENQKYKNIYKRTKIVQISKEITEQLGFSTNVGTKPLLISGLGVCIRDQTLNIPSNQILHEMKSYLSKDSGKMTAPDGENDDTIIATALCIEGLRTHASRLIGDSGFNNSGYKDDDTSWI